MNVTGRIRLKRLLPGLAAIAAFALTTGTAHGGDDGDDFWVDETETTGSFSVTAGAPLAVIPVSEELCIIDLPATFTLTGSAEGSFSSVFHIEHLGPCEAYAPEYFTTSGTYEGAIDGAPGTFEYTFEGWIDLWGYADGELLVHEGTGTGELAEVKGSLRLAGQAGVGGDYGGEVELD